MVKVAILGGTGHVGRTLVEALQENPDHSVIAIGRQAPTKWDFRAPVVAADYSSVESLVSVLEQHQIEVVISGLLLENAGVAKSQANAIDAAEKSSTTNSFIASNWSVPSDSSNPYAGFQIAAQEHLSRTTLAWTEIAPGYFLDFWGLPIIKSHMIPMLPAIDIKHRVAGIPGTGNQHVAFSYSFDVARFISEKLLPLPRDQWEPTTIVVGDRLTWNEFLALAEDVRGSKFDVSYDSKQDLLSGKLTELPNHVEVYPFFPKPALQGLYIGLGLLMADGSMDIPLEKSLNRRKFPDFKMLTVKELLEQTWKGKP